MRANPRHSGYTLIEVLVAFMILALALTVLLRIFSTGLRNVSVSSDYARAILVAETQLASVGVISRLEPGETRGNDSDKFNWTRVVTNYVPFNGYYQSATQVPAYYITVTVEWPHAGRTRQVNLSSIRLGAPKRSRS
ncbi:MAG: prepilin-type N-terminal cleavage/methylation domain-containing protein [Gammaproteobacteria bacterium]|nr:prepilin-type N-terminal cleavage/methylation domain-containing protein [Gammaproteobacteria bacterium]MDH3429240.1 prepilin-type N-terminal cleavage/methylation domain-containing protein [Gammaproteobacteria bacterium]MDH3433229.1 prepilin-type N-terminal cleavage/methylation domain-containing protein [Gammaproteobacteria bacterium]